jgi:predicted Zn-dependent protease
VNTANRFAFSFGLMMLSCTLLSCKELEQATRTLNNPTLTTVVDITKRVTKAADALLPITYDEETAIGQAIAVQVVSRYGGLVNDPAHDRYVNLVGRTVADTSDRPGIPYDFAILNHDSLNAFASPAGYVFVTRGLLNAAKNEAELAAVLGHEVAHVSTKHILTIIQRSKQIAGVAEEGLEYLKQNPARFKGLIDEATKKLLDEGLDRDKELEADRLGVVFASRAGYDPTAYEAFLARLRTIKGDDLALFKSHPNFSERIEAVQETVIQRGLKSNGVLLAERFAKSVKRT